MAIKFVICNDVILLCQHVGGKYRLAAEPIDENPVGLYRREGDWDEFLLTVTLESESFILECRDERDRQALLHAMHKYEGELFLGCDCILS